MIRSRDSSKPPTRVLRGVLAILLVSAGWLVAECDAQDRYFVRGDLNGDGSTGLPDAIEQLDALFISGTFPEPCMDAADTNDDGQFSLVDVIFLLDAFIGGSSLPAPWRQCGPDPTPDALPCDFTARCFADFGQVVVIGDSLAAGFSSGSLIETEQAFSFPAQLVAAAGEVLPQPLIAAPGFPNIIELVAPGFPPMIQFSPGQTTGRIDPMLVARNVAVTGATVADALTQRPDLPIDSTIDFVIGEPWLTGLGLAPTQIEVAENLSPSVGIVWLGANDALSAGIFGDPAQLTDPVAFAMDYAEVLTRLDAATHFLVVGTIPNPASVTFLVPVDTIALAAGQTVMQAAMTLGVDVDALVPLTAVQLALDILAGTVLPPLPTTFVLTPSEAATITAAVDGFNQTIRAEALLHDAVVVETGAIFDQIAANDVVVGPVTLTLDYLGGVSSLDAIHPTRTGQALVAQAFAAAIEAAWSNDLTDIDVDAVRMLDPLAP